MPQKSLAHAAKLSTSPAPERAIIADVQPQIDAGRYPIKRCVGELVQVRARIFVDGHDRLSACIWHRPKGAKTWQEVALEPADNDYWHGSFGVSAPGEHEFTVLAWVSHFGTFRDGLRKKWQAGQNVQMELATGVELLKAVRRRAKNDFKELVDRCIEQLSTPAGQSMDDQVRLALDATLAAGVDALFERKRAKRYERVLKVWVDDALAGFSSWYEMFPRSLGEAGRHGTFADVQAHLPYVAEMGFDILYLPPIHPIGSSHRKGPNNALLAGPNDPGSPWAIGSEAGGHKSVHPELGSLQQFADLVRTARNEYGIELALDIAFQCSPDHPYVKQHPEWFKKRPDGSIQYAENPPKKYQDVYPFDFECQDWQALWQELLGVFEFWINQGVRVFRVDNPHTKPFDFWEWAIAKLREQRQDLIFLAEAFTRPSPMQHLAKLGFNQSYTYFTWRNDKAGLTAYVDELSRSSMREYYRPCFWPNTPDILNEYLHHSGRGAFMTRFILAATLMPNYGIYGPAFELCEGRPLKAGSEEYLDSEKYQLRSWPLNAAHSLKPLIARVNRLRREHSALRRLEGIQFHPTDNEQIICYSKMSADGQEVLVMTVNLDAQHEQAAWVVLPVDEWGLVGAYDVCDELTGTTYGWHGPTNYVALNPQVLPAHILRLRLPRPNLAAAAP